MSLLTYKVTADHKPFWSAIIKAESHYEALLSASLQFHININNLDAQIWASSPNS